MIFPQSFKFLCLFLALGISIGAAQLYPELEPGLEPNYSYYYCNERTTNEWWEPCPEIYEPVCADYYGPPDISADVSFADYDAIVRKTFPNACSACQGIGAIGYRTGGPCEGDCGEECEEGIDWEKFVEEYVWY